MSRRAPSRRLALLAAVLLAGALSAAAAPAGEVAACDDVVDPKSLDPFREFGQKSQTVLAQIVEGLARLDASGNVEPALAESWEQVDPLRLRFHLRRGVVFHDGENFDAESVRFSLERYLAPETRYPGRGMFALVEKVVVVDPYTVEVVTRAPDGALLRRLAGILLIVPPSYYKKAGPEGFSAHPDGTGPFEFVSWTRGRQIELRANARYWDPGLPRIAKLTFRFIPIKDQLAALLSGRVDIVTDLPGTATYAVKSNPATDVLKKEGFFTVAATFNTSRSPLSDVRFRRALNFAVNRDELIRYDVEGNGRPLASLSMPGQVGHDPDLRPYPYDREKALALIRETGLKPPIRLKGFAVTQAARTAKILAAQWKSVGIDLELEVLPEMSLLERIQGETWDIGIGSLPDPTGDAGFIQSILLYSHSPYSLFRSEEYDRRLEAFVSALTPADQGAKGRALDRYLHDEALSVFTYQRIRTCGVNRRIRFTPFVAGMDSFRDVSLAPAPGTGGAAGR